MIFNIHAFTPTGKIKRPSYSTVATWVKESWDEVDEDLIWRSFKSYGISTNIDGSEDDCIFDNNLLDDVDDEVVENSNNDDEEFRHRLKELKKIYKVKIFTFVLFYFDLLLTLICINKI